MFWGATFAIRPPLFPQPGPIDRCLHPFVGQGPEGLGVGQLPPDLGDIRGLYELGRIPALLDAIQMIVGAVLARILGILVPAGRVAADVVLLRQASRPHRADPIRLPLFLTTPERFFILVPEGKMGNHTEFRSRGGRDEKGNSYPFVKFADRQYWLRPDSVKRR